MDWKNQFYDVPDSEILRTTVDIPHTINSQIKSYEPKTGVLQNTISILVTKLSNELKQSKLLVSDRYGYQVGLTGAVLILGNTKPDSITLADGTVYVQRSSVGLPPDGLQHTNASQTVGGNDNGRAVAMARKAKRASKLSSVTKPRRSDGAGSNSEKGK